MPHTGLSFHAHHLTVPPELRGIGVRLEQHVTSTDYMRRISHSSIGSCYKQIGTLSHRPLSCSSSAAVWLPNASAQNWSSCRRYRSRRAASML